MNKKAVLVIALILIATLVPFAIFSAEATLSAGPDQTVTTGHTVDLNGTTTDDLNTITQVTWDFGDNTTEVNGTSPTLLNATHTYLAIGVYNATLTVKFDSTLNKTETASATITVIENEAPVADAGPDQFVEQTSIQGSNVTLDGSASYDPDNDTLTYDWTWANMSASGEVVTALFPPGNTTVTLLVSDGQLNATDEVNIVVQDTTPPVVDVSQNVTVEAGTLVTLNGTAVDAVSVRFNFTWIEMDAVLKTETNSTDTTLTETFGYDINIITLNATDEAGNTGSANVTVNVTDTIPPIVSITPQNATVEAGTPLMLIGTANDNGTNLFNFTWSEGNNVLKTETNAPNTTLAYDTTFKVGPHIVTLNATDEAGNVGSANVTFTVIDTTPPNITAVAPSALWPPNHKYVEVKVNVTAADLGDPAPNITLVSVTSNEPDNAKGDGNTVNDIVIVDNFTFNLRAERAGNGMGRTYTITYSATDASGNSAISSVTIEVPHNQ